MEESLVELRKRLQVNTMQIEQLVANKRNIGDLTELRPDDYVRVKKISEKLLREWQEARAEGGRLIQMRGRLLTNWRPTTLNCR